MDDGPDTGYQSWNNQPGVDPMNDSEAMMLLAMLHHYLTDAGPESTPTVPEIAADLAMSLDVTPDWADRFRRDIEEAYQNAE